MPATNSAGTRVEECEDSQLFKLMDSVSKMKLELIEAERKKKQKLAEHAQIEYKMQRLKSKIVSLLKMLGSFVTNISQFHSYRLT